MDVCWGGAWLTRRKKSCKRRHDGERGGCWRHWDQTEGQKYCRDRRLKENWGPGRQHLLLPPLLIHSPVPESHMNLAKGSLKNVCSLNAHQCILCCSFLCNNLQQFSSHRNNLWKKQVPYDHFYMLNLENNTKQSKVIDTKKDQAAWVEDKGWEKREEGLQAHTITNFTVVWLLF